MSDLLYVVVDCVVPKEEVGVVVEGEVDVATGVIVEETVVEIVVEDEVVADVVNCVVVEDEVVVEVDVVTGVIVEETVVEVDVEEEVVTDVVEDEHKVGRGIHSP